MRRGELWRASSSVRDRMILVVSAQVLIDRGATKLYGVEASTENPGAILLVVPVEVQGVSYWLNVQRGVTRVYRPHLTEPCGVADQAVIDQVDALLRVALDL